MVSELVTVLVELVVVLVELASELVELASEMGLGSCEEWGLEQLSLAQQYWRWNRWSRPNLQQHQSNHGLMEPNLSTPNHRSQLLWNSFGS